MRINFFKMVEKSKLSEEFESERDRKLDQEIQKRIIDIQAKYREFKPVQKVVPLTRELIFKYGKGVRSATEALEDFRHEVVEQIDPTKQTPKNDETM